jgi:hypothetical protein
MSNNLEDYIKLLKDKEKYVEQLEKNINRTYKEIDNINKKIDKLKYNNNINNENFINKVKSILIKNPCQLYYQDIGNYPLFNLNSLGFDLYKLSMEDLNDILNNKIVRTFDDDWTVFISINEYHLRMKRDEIRYGY